MDAIEFASSILHTCVLNREQSCGSCPNLNSFLFNRIGSHSVFVRSVAWIPCLLILRWATVTCNSLVSISRYEGNEPLVQKEGASMSQLLDLAITLTSPGEGQPDVI